MAEKYVARIGNVWKNKKTGKVYSREMELSSGDDILNYTQISEQLSELKPQKETNSKKIRFNDMEDTKWQ